MGVEKGSAFLLKVSNGASPVAYAGDYNGERNYTMSLESSGPVVSA